MRRKNLILICIIIFIAGLFSGCDYVDSAKVKLGLKNKDFEYIKQGKVKNIIIQNVRDKGYKFVVTNPVAISELYDILSDAKPVDEKSTLQPDYIFEITEDSKTIHKFNYIVGLDPKSGGNLYSDDKNYIVNNRLDSNILKNFNDVRTPKDFNKLYYTFISECIDKYRSDVKNKNKSIGIDINDDVEVQKYIFSTDLDDFDKSLPSNVTRLQNQNDKADIIEKVNTDGYKYGNFKDNGISYTGSYIYRCTVTFDDNTSNSEKKYYVKAILKSDAQNWSIDISDKAS